MWDRILSRVLMMSVLLIQLACIGVAWAEARRIEGIYRNPALGYSISIPRGLTGLAGDEAGPERGVRIPLPSGGKIAVFGEPNTLESADPEAGVRAELSHAPCMSDSQEVKQARVGKLDGAQATVVCGQRVLHLILTFRARGGPIYWLRLETDRAHELEDNAVLKNVAESFKLIRWK